MISLGGALLTARYVARALREAERTPRGLYRSLERQIEVATVTIAMERTLDRYCGCAEMPIPMVYAQCPPCTLRARLTRVATQPAHYTTSQQHDVIEACSMTLRAAGYMS
jgi:hypothetical protein